MKGVI